MRVSMHHDPPIPVIDLSREITNRGRLELLNRAHRNLRDYRHHGHLNRRTARNAAMFLPGGHAYVYRSYGIHWCLNVVCGPEDEAEAVLIRALRPTAGLDAMRARRGVEDERALCSGPGKLCQALGVDRRLDGLPLDEPPFELRPRRFEPEIAAGPRIGITKAQELPWRFGLAGSRFLSRPLRPA